MIKFLVDSYSETNHDTEYYSIRDGYPDVGQSFTGFNSVLYSCKFYLKRAGTISGSCYGKVYAHTGTFGSSSTPTGDALAVSDGVDVITIDNGAYEVITFTFTGADKITLVGGTKYCIDVYFDGGSPGNCIYVGTDSSSPTHGGNAFYSETGPIWHSNGGWDVCFYIYAIPPIYVGFFLFMCEAYEKGKKYFKNKGLYLPDNRLYKPEILIPEGI